MPPEGNSIRDELVAAFAESRKPESTQGAEPRAESPPIEDSKPAAPDGGSKRDADAGAPPKGAAKSDGDKPAAKADDKAAGDKKPDGDESALEPPARWTKEQKEEFAALDPKIQRILLSRNKGLESDYTKKMQDIASERMRYAQLEGLLAPRRQTWERSGMNDQQALTQIFAYWDMASKDPVGFVQHFAQQRGIDLAAHFAPRHPARAPAAAPGQQGAPQPGGQDTGGQPQAGAALHPDVIAALEAIYGNQQHLQQELSAHKQWITQRAQGDQAAVQAAARDEFVQFKSATDDHGQPRYPFLEDVKGDMAKLMESGYATTLADAYDKAVRVRTDIWSKIEESREIARRRENEARRAADAERAKLAGSSVHASSVDRKPAANDDDDDSLSLRAMLERQFAQARAGSRI